MNHEIILKPGKEKLPRKLHPWIFASAIASSFQNINIGEAVSVFSHDGNFIAHGFMNPESQLSIRLVSWKREEQINEREWFSKIIRKSIHRRSHIMRDTKHNSMRLVHSEADHLPGLVADRFGGHVVIMISSAAMVIREKMICDIFSEIFPDISIHVDYDTEYLKKEKINPPEKRMETESFSFLENSCNFTARPGGQKTGFYLDQKYNRARIAEYAGEDMDVLDAFCFSGGFTIPILMKNAKVTAVDSSADAISLLLKNVRLNPEIRESNLTAEKGNVFSLLRKYRDAEKSFDLIIQDPPRMSPRKHDNKKALTGYKDLFLQSIFLLKPGGLLAGFSCSYHVNLSGLKEALAWAALDAGREASVIEIFSQGPDHPVPASFPEAEYLSGFLAIVD